jgi:hypothetical protein
MIIKIKVTLFSIVIGLMFICCAANPEIGQVTHGTPVNGDYFYVWDSILEVLSERNIAVATLDEEVGIISTDWVVISEKNNGYCDCGSPKLSPLDVIQAKFNVFVEFIAEGATSVKIAALYQLNNRMCGSTGKFESEILTSLQGRI